MAIGPLCEIALDAGYDVSGSDMSDSLMVRQLRERGVDIALSQDSGHISDVHARSPIDWFVYTAALPQDHAELAFAKEHGIRTSKRDELLAEIIREKQLKLIAVSGTHGKTTTTGMLVWAFKQLGLPVSYSVGTTLSFGPSGHFDDKSQYFVYECDEFDRNMLHFSPYLSLITSLDHDHFDTYPTVQEYRDAFVQFLEQSDYTLLWERDLRYLHSEALANTEAYDEQMNLSHIQLPGNHMRHNAYLVERALRRLFPEVYHGQIIEALNQFPGTQRRFEKLAENLYTDYGHHPAEIAATLQMARELSDHVVLVYQPHQNIRQHEIRNDYTGEIFKDADEIYWLPTYLSREDPSLEVLIPQQLTQNLAGKESLHFVDMNDELWTDIQRHCDAGHLVLAMGAGSIDSWIRSKG